MGGPSCLSLDEDACVGPGWSDSVMVSDFHSIRQFGKLLWISSTAHAKFRYRSAFLGEGSNEVSMCWGGILSPVQPVWMLLSSFSLISFTSSLIMSNRSSGVSVSLLGCSCGVWCGACSVGL